MQYIKVQGDVKVVILMVLFCLCVYWVSVCAFVMGEGRGVVHLAGISYQYLPEHHFN